MPSGETLGANTEEENQNPSSTYPPLNPFRLFILISMPLPLDTGYLFVETRRVWKSRAAVLKNDEKSVETFLLLCTIHSKILTVLGRLICNLAVIYEF